MTRHTFTGTPDEARELAEMLNDKRRHESKEDRVAREMKLRDEGMSTRAIADVVGTSHTQVRRDLQAGGDMSPPQPDPETAAPEQPEVKPDPEPEPPKVTGLDGKS